MQKASQNRNKIKREKEKGKEKKNYSRGHVSR